MMTELDNNRIYSEVVKAGKRVYFFDVKMTKNGEKYVSITESKRVADAAGDNSHVSYEKHKLFVYKEDYDRFLDALAHTFAAAKEGGCLVQPCTDGVPEDRKKDVSPLSVEFDF